MKTSYRVKTYLLQTLTKVRILLLLLSDLNSKQLQVSAYMHYMSR